MTPSLEHAVVASLAFVGGALAVAGVGCAAAVLGAAFPAVARANDRTARESGTTGPLLIGTLVVLGTLVALSGASKAGPGPTWAAAILLGLPTALLWLAGLTGAAPLLGERCLGVGGIAASPIRRSIVASLAVGFAALPFALAQFAPMLAILGLIVFGWPTGVALLATIARFRRTAPPPPPPVPPAP